MEPLVHGHPVAIDVHCPPARDQNSLVTAITVDPPVPRLIPWLRHVFHTHLGHPMVRFAGGGPGHILAVFLRQDDQTCALRASPIFVDGRTLHIFPHDQGENSFTFFYRFMVCLTLEKFPVNLWDRRGVAASVSGFANLVNIDHACMHGHDYAAIFVMVKVEELCHIPHHIAFYKANLFGVYADVFVNEIWDIDGSMPPPSPPPRPPRPARGRRGARGSGGQNRVWRARDHAQPAPALAGAGASGSSSRTLSRPDGAPAAAALGAAAFLATAPKLPAITYPVRTPTVTVTFEQASFHVQVHLSLRRSAEAWIMVSQVDDLDYPTFPCFNLTTECCNPAETTRSLLFSLLPLAGASPLLLAIDCRNFSRKICPTLTTLIDASPLSLAPLAEQPLRQPISLSTICAHMRSNPPILAPPICTLPPAAATRFVCLPPLPVGVRLPCRLCRCHSGAVPWTC
uniref:Uncharacterized protein n=1 Tax=Oryza glumipatula TaxID=40148 RepID=A0A0E0BD57_9ORYZ